MEDIEKTLDAMDEIQDKCGNTYIPKHDENYDKLSDRRKVGILLTLATGHQLCAFDDMHQMIEERLGRPVFTHEFARDKLWKDIKETITVDDWNLIGGFLFNNVDKLIEEQNREIRHLKWKIESYETANTSEKGEVGD